MIPKDYSGDVRIDLIGENTLNSANGPAIDKSSTVGNEAAAGKLTISGNGSLTAKAGDNSRAAAIGGSDGFSGANIVIEGSVTVTATGGSGIVGGGSGIGGGGNGGGGNGGGGTVTINGGTVTATGGSGISGIKGSSSRVNGNGGNGIGGGGTVTINGGTVTAIGGSGSGIYYGFGGNGIGIGGDSGNVTINSGTVIATGGNGSGMDDSGSGFGGNGISVSSSGTLTIHGGTVTATGGSNGYSSNIGITGGSIAITGGSINARIRGTPTNADGSPLALLTARLLVNEGIPFINGDMNGSTLMSGANEVPYEFSDVRTGEDGKLYLWIPTETKVTTFFTKSGTYFNGAGVNAGESGDFAPWSSDTQYGIEAVLLGGPTDARGIVFPWNQDPTKYVPDDNGGGKYQDANLLTEARANSQLRFMIDSSTADSPDSPNGVVITPLADGYELVGLYLNDEKPTGTSYAVSGSFTKGYLGWGSGSIYGGDTYKFSMPEQNTKITAYIAKDGVAPPTITTTSLPNGKVGEAYSHTITAAGGPDLTWIVSGAPNGMAMENSTNVFSGTPDAAGKYNVKFGAGNDRWAVNFKTLTLVIEGGALSAPTGLAWDSTAPGTATWGAVDHASSYIVELYKGGTRRSRVPVIGGVTSYNFSSTIARLGEGSYTFKVLAEGDGTVYQDSELSSESGAYVYNPVAAPTFTPAGGSYDSAQDVSITCATQGAKIYYTTDGSNPTTSSAEYSVPVTVDSSMTLKAIAVKDGMTNSGIAQAVYTITTTPPTPDTTPPTGEIKIGENGWKSFLNAITFGLFFKDTQEVEITAQDEGGEAVAIAYHLHRGETALTEEAVNALGSSDWTAYTNKISIAPDDKLVVYAKLTDQSGNVSYINTEGIVLDNTAPTFSLTNGETYTTAKTLTVSDNYALASVKLGVEEQLRPGFTGTQTTVDLNTNGTHTITAEDKAGNSASITVTINISPVEQVATPKFNPGGGIYNSAQTVEITCDTESAKIYYTTDGSDPTTSSTEYTVPVTVDSSRTLKAIAVKDGMTNSGIAQAVYTIESAPTHSHSWAQEWSSDSGYHWHECTANDCPITEASGKDGYDAHHESEWITTQQPTETEAGSKKKECTVCKRELATEEIPATGLSHTHSITHIQRKEPTCVEDGHTEYWYCGDCGKYFSDSTGTTEITLSETVLDATGVHTGAGEWQKDDSSHWKLCSVCNQQTDRAAHSGGTANCHAKAVCEVCGANYGAVDLGNHDGPTELRNQKEATETEKGYTGDTYCLGCGNLLQTGTETPMLDPDTYILTIQAGTGGQITLGTSSSYTQGTRITIEARANTDYAFDGWTTSHGGAFDNANSARTIFTMPAGATTITANFRYTGSGGSSGGGGGSDRDDESDSGDVTVLPSKPTEQDPNPPTESVITPPATVDKDGEVEVDVSDKDIQDAVDKALDQAKKDGTEANGVAVNIDLSGLQTTFSQLPLTLSKNAYGLLVEARVKYISIITQQVSLYLDLETLQTIYKSATGDVTINAVQTENSKLPAGLKDRPAYDLNIVSGDKTISSFNGEITVSFPYTPKPGEVSSGLRLAYVDENGRSKYVTGSGYDAARKAVVGHTGHFTVFGIADLPAFTDVTGHWAESNILFVVERGLLYGTSATTFSPQGAVTRAQVWTTLARLDGADTSGGAPWYAPAQSWAVKKGVSDGANPDAPVTREQLVTMLYRYAQAAGYDVSVGEDTNILSYTDALDVAEWAIPAMQWACGSGVVSGTSATTLSPQAGATRAQLAVILQRFSSETE